MKHSDVKLVFSQLKPGVGTSGIASVPTLRNSKILGAIPSKNH
jgi:hypothetical protein